jgi:hypothetical protein
VDESAPDASHPEKKGHLVFAKIKLQFAQQDKPRIGPLLGVGHPA